MIGWSATERNNGKIELDSISKEERLRQLFAVYSCKGTEFSYIFFTEQRNFTTAEQRNGNGRTATEWWKPGITHSSSFGLIRGLPSDLASIHIHQVNQLNSYVTAT